MTLLSQTAEFNMLDTACQDQNISIDNQSTSVVEYYWDFCVGDLSQSPSPSILLTDSDLNQVFSNSVLKTDSYQYVFAANFSSNKLIRLKYNLDFTNLIEKRTYASPLLDGPNSIEVLKYENNWYGFVSNFNTDEIIRIDFGDNLDNDPGFEVLVSSEELNSPTGLTYIYEGESFYLLAVNGSNSDPSIVKFEMDNPSSLINSLMKHVSPFGSSLRGIDIKRVGTDYVGFIASFNGNTLVRLDISTSLSNPPSFSADANLSYLSNTDVSMIYEGGKLYSYVIQRNGSLLRHRFALNSNSIESSSNLGNLGTLTGNSFGLTLVNDSSKYYALVNDYNANRLYLLDFENDCVINGNHISTSFEPVVNYSAAGYGKVALTSTTNDSIRYYDLDSVLITSNFAPSISISLDASRCITNANTFTPSITGLSSYSWDFDGNGIEDSNAENPQVLFDTLGGAGTYTVRLDVSDGSCDNFYEKDITIYPDPPIPSFTVTSGSTFCTNNELTLTNTTDETGYDDVLSYQWVIDGDEVNQKDTVYTFTDSGIKTITLQSFLPGCSSILSSQDITIDEGPDVSFSYTNNCFGEAISFISEVTGANITSYAWDFGDGVGTSSQADTVYQYATAGTYTVQLTVGNVAGCETVYSEDITVNDGVLADFTFDEAIENLPVQFSAVDQTLSNDSIISWSWDFSGLGNSSQQNPIFTFSEGSFTVDLSVQTAQGCMFTVQKEVVVAVAARPTSSFSISSTSVCVDEQLEIENTSVNAISYEWDFCLGDYLNPAEGFDLGVLDPEILSSVFDQSTVLNSSGGFHSYILSTGNNHLFRIDFDSLSSDYTITDLGDLGIGEEKRGIIIEHEGSQLFGFIGTLEGVVYRILLDSYTDSSPSIDSLGEYGVSDLRGFDLVTDVHGNKYAIVSGGGDSGALLILDFSSSYLGIVSSHSIRTISGVLFPTDVQLVRESSNWYGLVSGAGSNFHHLSLGSSLSSGSVTVTSLGIGRSAGFGLVNETGEYVALVNTTSIGVINRLNFGASLSHTSPTVDDTLGNVSGLFNTNPAFEVIKGEGIHYMLGIGFNTNQYSMARFSDTSCESSLGYFAGEAPVGVSYTSAGVYDIELRAIDENGNVDIATEQVTVKSDIAPDASFNIDINKCISNANTFTPSVTGLSYSWDFNNDGIEDSNEESPQVLFDTLGGAGTYTVRLDVSDGSCNNFIEQEITIYNPPPAPAYTVSATRYCIDAPIVFNNTTDDASYAGPLTYSWEFIDDATSTVVGTSDEENPTFSFNTSGTKTVILTSNIPGCEETTQQTITINPSPTAGFSATSVCQEEPMLFTNSSANADTYFWDFGDGFTSTAENPSHIFTASGNYSVALTATDSNGCDNTTVNEVSVSATPVPNFDFDIPCTSSEGIQFFDMSTVENADIVSWTWEVDGVEESTEQNPTILFDSEGIKTIGLTTVSSNGCESFYTEDIEILAAPQPDFQTQIGCQGEASSFMDNTTFSGNIVSYVWTIDGVTYNSENVDHIFESPGIYDVSLEVTGQNFCSESITRQIEVLQLPAADFDISGTCDNEILEATDLSQAFNDAIVSRTWLLDGEAVGNGSELFLNSLESGTYTLTLELQTAAGCVTSYSEPLEINNAPTASFTASKNHGLPNDRINFTNSSIGAVDYQWLLNGSQFGTSADAESITFSEVGTQVVSLVAQNSLGCIDTTSQEILIAIPEVDLAIGNLELVAEDNTGRIFLEVQNFSNLPIEITKAEITLEDQFKITEQIEQFVEIGETRLVSLNIGVPLTNSEPGYLCVNLVSEYVGYPDINPLDNEKCINIQPVIKVENPFPNPVTDRFRLKVVAPNGGDATLRLINSAGKIQIQKTYSATEGLNNFFVEMSTLDPGIYFVTVDISGTIFKRKVIKL
ncbi:PKD domain-containing protein [Ekhidna sp.]|uniref:PKD domain-containing protein n=1 Tax=Ekhidna sp. TaxID=2608089 RepID=UPI003CCB9CD3